MNEAYCEVKEKKEYTEQIRRWNDETEASGSEMGEDIEKLLNNDAYLREKMQLSEVDITISPNQWVGDSPCTTEITIQGADAECTVYVLPHPEITVDQYRALAEASIIGGDQGENTVQLRAYGARPATDLPLRFLVSGMDAGKEDVE